MHLIRETGEGAADSIFVSWSTSYSKNFGTPKSNAIPGGNGAEATSYTLTLHQRGESYFWHFNCVLLVARTVVTPTSTTPCIFGRYCNI